MGTNEEARSGEEEDCTMAKGGRETRLLRDSINESSGEIVRG